MNATETYAALTTLGMPHSEALQAMMSAHNGQSPLIPSRPPVRRYLTAGHGMTYSEQAWQLRSVSR